MSPVVAADQLCCDDEGGQFSGTLPPSVLPQVRSTGFGSPTVTLTEEKAKLSGEQRSRGD